jgi:hypothetical protein
MLTAIDRKIILISKLGAKLPPFQLGGGYGENRPPKI